MYIKRKIVIVSALVLSLLLCSILIFANNLFEKRTSIDYEQSLSIKQQLQENNQEIIRKEQFKKKPVIIAVYGSDTISTEIARSDVIMLIKYNPLINKADMISIPRDSRVEIPENGMDKINHAYAFGGAKLLNQTLDKLFDTKIDYYLIFKFKDFEDIVNKFGGVKVNAKKNYGYDPDKPMILKGESILTGKQALFYVRYRHDEEGDFGRIKRQQEVIQSLYQKLYRGGFEKQKTTEIYLQDLETDIDISTFLEYTKMVEKSTHIKFENYILETSDAYINGKYYGIVNRNSLEVIKKRLNQ